MFTTNTRVVWTTDAIATLVYRDRRVQVEALMEFLNLMRGVLVGGFTKCIDGKEQLYFTSVAGGSHVIFWKYLRDEDLVEVQAVGGTLLWSAAEVDELISRDGLKSLRSKKEYT